MLEIEWKNGACICNGRGSSGRIREIRAAASGFESGGEVLGMSKDHNGNILCSSAFEKTTRSKIIGNVRR
jgi:hypothetical protein